MRRLPGLLVVLACQAGWAMPAHAGAADRSTHAATHTVTVEAMQFSPATLEVKVGDTVTWTNKDAFAHTVTAAGKQFNSGPIESGAAWKFKARKKGVYPYICSLHPSMKAVLVVQ
jgi:plastocyanin